MRYFRQNCVSARTRKGGNGQSKLPMRELNIKPSLPRPIPGSDLLRC